MRIAERRKVNVLDMKCLRSLAGVSRMDLVKNENVRRRIEIEREFASRADQRYRGDRMQKKKHLLFT